MFGIPQLRDSIEDLKREVKNALSPTSWKMQGLERQVQDLHTWNEKIRDKNSALRRERRRLRQLLTDHNIVWEQAN